MCIQYGCHLVKTTVWSVHGSDEGCCNHYCINLLHLLHSRSICLQGFDAVAWVAARVSGLVLAHPDSHRQRAVKRVQCSGSSRSKWLVPFSFSTFHVPQLYIMACLYATFQFVIVKRLTVFHCESTTHVWRMRTQWLLYLQSLTLLLLLQPSTQTHARCTALQLACPDTFTHSAPVAFPVTSFFPVSVLYHSLATQTVNGSGV